MLIIIITWEDVWSGSWWGRSQKSSCHKEGRQLIRHNGFHCHLKSGRCTWAPSSTHVSAFSPRKVVEHWKSQYEYVHRHKSNLHIKPLLTKGGSQDMVNKEDSTYVVRQSKCFRWSHPEIDQLARQQGVDNLVGYPASSTPVDSTGICRPL